MQNMNLRQKIVQAGRILFLNGHDDLTRGHVSVRLPSDPSLFLMKPHSIGLEELTVEGLQIIDLDGNVVEGDGRRHSEVFIHSEVYRARPDVNSVLHTHPTHCVALSATGRPLKPVSQPAVLFHESLSTFSETITLIRTPEVGARVAHALADNRALILRHHGIVCIGASIEEAVISAIMLESAAQIQLLVNATGCESEQFQIDDILKLQESLKKADQFAVNFEYLARRLA